jgi:hypothetical protein
MRNPTAPIILAALAASLLQGRRVEAQSAEPARPFGLFSGAVSTGDLAAQIGASVAFRAGDFPWPLRASIQAGRELSNSHHDAISSGTTSLDAVMRPVAPMYLLGGLGLFQQASYMIYGDRAVNTPGGPIMQSFADRVAGRSWGFAAAGVGVDVRRAFIEGKIAMPVTPRGDQLLLLSAGFHL